ncbi:ABC transporter permease [Halorarum salinum]|uniref:ABC transporter permease n=1 Tax=Halorarum salinum TaxID=2743089 RepID=A0A7D5QFI8_9EURY|nr:ABC transporter permease [Halobaculum salinum]QLG61422.1 ABC transporter permease [Halobaculum salinum]
MSAEPDADRPSIDDRAPFETIDWEAIEASPRPALRTSVFLVALGSFAVAFLYDLLIVPPYEPTVASWDVTALDWLFMLTLLLVGCGLLVPLATNRRLIGHYWRRFRRNRAAVVSLWYLAAVFGLGIVGPAVLPQPTLNVAHSYLPPVGTTVPAYVPVECLGPVVEGACRGTWAHPLGTTRQGKDVLVLVVYGMRVSMEVGLVTSLLVVTIGTAVGAVAAYVGGLVDEVLMRYVDVQQTFPTFFLYLLLVYLFGGSLFLLIIIFGLTSWGGVARLVRSEALQRREEGYVTAAVVAGANRRAVVLRHIVPNVSNTVITATTLLIPGLVLAEAALSFLGLGDPTAPSWGQVIASGRGDLADAWWVSTVPGVFLFLTVLAFNFLGDALRDALDPRVEP